MLQKVKFFNKKGQVVGRPDFPSILPVKSYRFLGFEPALGPYELVCSFKAFRRGQTVFLSL